MSTGTKRPYAEALADAKGMNMKLTPEQLAEIRGRHEMQGHSDYIWADVSARQQLILSM